MTFIRPNKKVNVINGIFILMGLVLVVGVFGMVVLYNATVNLSHNISLAKQKLDSIGAENTDMSNKIIATLSGTALANAAAKDGLVTDPKPQYFPVNHEWPIASQY